MSRFVKRVLLFDLLSDHEPEIQEESPVLQYYTREEFMASIKNELNVLLNTRCTMTWQEYEKSEHLEFGLPSFFGLLDRAMSLRGGVSGMDAVKFLVKKAVERFETRLTNVMVEVTKGDHFSGFFVNISGQVFIDDVVEKVFFPVHIKENVQAISERETEAYRESKPTLRWPKDKKGNPVIKL